MEKEPVLEVFSEIKKGDIFMMKRESWDEAVRMEVINVIDDEKFFCEMIDKPSVNGVFTKKEIVSKE